MPITQALNSKANVKKLSTSDIPFASTMPVISSYYGVSTSSQTVINLPFSIDTNNTDIFFLFIDGKKLTLGSSNDYTFTAIAADKTSSQVTLTQSLVVGLNIQAYKMGLKKESEFQTDNRFVAAYDYLDQSFQAFVAQNLFLTATSSAGTPVAGKFYSSIQNRASIVDITQDLKARMGIDRIPVQQIYAIQNEFGPNGEPVFAALNDDRGQARFVGNWINQINTNGTSVTPSTNGDTSSYLEITFYGTGLNLVTEIAGGSALDLRYTVDGGTEVQFSTITPNTNLAGRNYTPNNIFPVINGLTLGVHTVKVRGANSTTWAAFFIAGYEILNESSLVKVNPGVSYIKGQKYVSSSQQTFSYNSAVTGTRGGRVLVYQNGDGSISQAFQATNTSAAFMSSADHTNEEIARTYYPREFGAARADDFSTLVGSTSNRAFTLEDGTATLVGQNAIIANNESVIPAALNDFIAFTFIGTGLDIVTGSLVATANSTITVDGVAVSTNALNFATANAIVKIASGLPYGTHVVKVTNTTNAVSPRFAQFKVYQPKKPSLPSGCVEVSDYNAMANYVANTTAGLDTIASGVLRKHTPTREAIYTGTVSGPNLSLTDIGGFNVDLATSGGTMSYTFFGTGFELRGRNISPGVTVVTVDGAFPSAGNVSLYGGSMSYNAANGQISGSGATGGGIVVQNLTLGLHTVKFACSISGDFITDCLDIITPIHSAKSNLFADLQDTLPVGSCGISDNRKTTAIKEALPVQKAWAQAFGSTSDPTTVSTAFIPMPDMSITIKTTGPTLEVSYAVTLQNSTGNNGSLTQIYVDGVAVGRIQRMLTGTAARWAVHADSIVVLVGPGTHKVDLYWSSDSGANTVTALGTNRTLKAKEF